MRPDWPALCLVCQGERLFGLHLEGLCVYDGGVRQRTGGSCASSYFRGSVGSAAQTSLSWRARPAGD